MYLYELYYGDYTEEFNCILSNDKKYSKEEYNGLIKIYEKKLHKKYDGQYGVNWTAFGEEMRDILVDKYNFKHVNVIKM